MVSLNPNLASTALSIQNQQTGATARPEQKLEERPQENQRVVSGGNSSVTLSESIEDSAVDYSQLAPQQTVQSSDSVENRSSEATQTNNGLTYASNLQTQANYLMNEITPNRDEETA